MDIHFIGIGGIGISALAQFCKNRGDTISGSESQQTGTFELLQNQGIEIKIPQQAKNIPLNCDLVIYTEAIGEDNPERVEALKRNLPIKTYFEFLGEISKDFHTIAVTGTHGKTTTTGLIAAGFKTAHFDATIFVGSKLQELGNANFHAGSNDFLLLEACEYRANFRFLYPEIVILTNAELDHVDFYKNEEHYIETFTEFCAKAKTVIYHKDDKNAQIILKNFTGQKIAVDSNDPSFKTSKKKLHLSGEHNRENAILALSCAQLLFEKEDAQMNQFKKGLEKFSGAWRRQEFLGEKEINNKKIQVFDDYGHHPTEIIATLQGLREKFPNKKIGLIFEPHQYSRTRKFFDEFLTALAHADFIGIFPIYAARDTQADKQSVCIDNFCEKNPAIQKIETQKDAQLFTQKLNENDILLFMGAGVIDVFAHEFLRKS